MKKINKRLVTLISHSKGQFIAIITVIVVGLMIYMSMASASKNLATSLDDYYEETNFADIYVEVLRMPEKAIPEIKAKHDFTGTEGRIVFDTPYITDDENERVTIRIISKIEETEINKPFFIEGEDINDKYKDILLAQKFAEARNVKVGDTIKMQISGKLHEMNVSGIIASPEYIYLIENAQSMLPPSGKFGVAFVSREFAQRNYGYSGSVNEIIIKTDGTEDLDIIKDNIKDDFEKYGLKRITIKDNQLSNRMISEELFQLEVSSRGVPRLFLGISALVLIMMLSRMVKRDRNTIGVLKGLGYTSFQVILHYTKYAWAVGFFGVLFGTVLGVALSGLMTNLYIVFFNIPMLKIDFYAEFIIFAIIYTFTFCSISGFIGARGVLKITPAESMRPEAPKKGKRIMLERVRFIWNRLSFSWKTIVKNIFRNKRRLIFVLLGVAITYSVIGATLGMMESTYDMMGKFFVEFQKMDYNVNFNRPINKNVSKEIGSFVDIEHVEPKIEFPFELKNGLRKEIVNIIGLEENTEFYSFKNANEEVVKIDETGIILSENLANELKVKKGDQIVLHSFVPDKDDVTIKVSEVIEQGLGMNAYMEIDYMGETLLDKEVATGLFVNSSDEDFVKKLVKADNIATIQSSKEMLAIYEEFMGLTIISITVMVVMAGILGFSIVYNATIISISEREMEFSSMRVLGFTKQEIFKIILNENIVIGIAGILLGIPLAMWMGESMANMYSNEIYTMEATDAKIVYVFAGICTFIFIMLSQFATYEKIKRLDFLQALKSRIS